MQNSKMSTVDEINGRDSRQVQTIHKGVDETDRVIPAHVIVHCFRQKQNLRAVNARNVCDGRF